MENTATESAETEVQLRRARHLKELEAKAFRVITKIQTLGQPLNANTLSKYMAHLMMAEGEQAAFAVQMYATNYVFEVAGTEKADEWNTKATMHFMGRKPYDGTVPASKAQDAQ